MERQLTVEFGPSRSKRFGKAVAEAERGPGECRELEPGRYRARFLLGHDASVYAGLARLLERVRHWRASEVYEGEETVSSHHARDGLVCLLAAAVGRGLPLLLLLGHPSPLCPLSPLR